MRELKVGDKVWIRKDLIYGEKYGNIPFSGSMERGGLVDVGGILDDGNFTIKLDSNCQKYSISMIDWDKTNEYNRNKINPNIVKYKEIFDQLLEVGFKRDEALKIMLNAGNVGKNTQKV